MNINKSTLIEAGSQHKEAQKILDRAMMVEEFMKPSSLGLAEGADWDDYIPPTAPEFQPEAQPDAIDAGIDAVEVTEEMTAPYRIVEAYVTCPVTGAWVPGKMAISQGATRQAAVLDAQTVLYYRRCARQMIHEGTYSGAKHCWDLCMGAGSSISQQALGNALKGYSWRVVGEELTKDEQAEAYRLTRANNRRLKQNKI